MAYWIFGALGDTREDYKRDQLFPEMIKEVNQTAYKIKDHELRLEFLLDLEDFECKRGSRESLEGFKARIDTVPCLHVSYQLSYARL